MIAKGAAVGAAVSSVVPVLGTTLGALGGAGIGDAVSADKDRQVNGSKGHYEYLGVNGIPTRVKSRISMANLPPQFT